MSIKRLIFIVFLINCIIFMCFPIQSLAKTENRVIKVGYFNFEGYQDYDKNGNRNGYGYEYLHEIAKYTGWTYEYVSGTWEECQTMLENGQIDLLTSAQYTKKRAEKFDFSEVPMGSSYAQLTVKSGSSKYVPNDYKNFNGIKVGLLYGNSRNEHLKEFASEKGFVYTARYFKNEEELESALKSGKVDAILTSSLRKIKNENVIAQFSPSPFYCIVKKGNAELLREVNEALEDIEMNNPAYKFNLYSKYYQSNNKDTFILSNKERDYLKRNNHIRVVSMTDSYPLSYLDKGKLKGIIPDIFTLIVKDLELSIDYVKANSYKEAIDMVKEGKADIICFFYSDYGWAEQNEIKITSPYIQLNYSAITKNYKNTKFNNMAVVESDRFNDEYIKEHYKNVNIQSYKSERKAINAVKSGDADVAFINTYSAEDYIQKDYNNLKSALVNDYKTNISLGVGKNINPTLYSILDKRINALDKDECSKIIANYTILKDYKVNLSQYIHQHPVQTVLISFCFFLIIIAVLFYIIAMNKRHSTHIFDLAFKDMANGVWNYNGFEEQAPKILEKHREKFYAVVAFDISKFSVINENYGRDSGDIIISEIASILNRIIGDRALIAHVKADHFLLLLSYDLKEDLECTLIDISKSISYFEVKGVGVKVKSNFGVYTIEDEDFVITKAIDYAEIARRKAKRSDLSIIYFDESLRESLNKEKEIVDRIDYALEHNEFQVYYQPKFDMRTNNIIGAEALVRWNHKELGFMNPGEFIPILEKSGGIIDVDFFVLEEVCKLMRFWIDSGIKPISISVNQSRAHFQKKNYINRLQNLLAKYDIPKSIIELEITESLFESDSISNDMINEIKELGFLISVDDFGSGYSSLYLLNQVSVDILKIDKSLLDNSEGKGKVGKIISKVVEMANDLGLEVICEGVEKIEQAEFLMSIDCYYAQGYLYAKPMPKDIFLKEVDKFKGI
ncbi:EAL domain-containing protein [Clostridioides difficile]